MDASESNGHQNEPNENIEQPPATTERPHAAVNDTAGGNQSNREETNWPQRIEAVCAVLLVIITGCYTYYAAGQLHKIKRSTEAAEKAANAAASAADTADKTLKEIRAGSADTHELAVQAKNQADESTKEVGAMKEANRINREALESVQRAFVLPGDVDPTIIGKEGAQSVRFDFHWNNSGTTPTKGMRTHVSYRWDMKPLPDDFPFPDSWEEGQPHVHTPALLGPKGSTAVDVGPIPTQVVDGVVQRYYHLNFWGWATYRDVFKDTPEHVTKFCYELIPFDVQTAKDSGLTIVKYRLDGCLHHNCYDDECKAEK